MKHFIPVAIVSVCLGACAGSPVPAAQMASAQAAIRTAREVGAEQNPTAALYLQYAREEYTQADQISRRGDGEQAARVLTRSQADAELSVALTRRAAARHAADLAVGQQQTFQANTPDPAPAPRPMQ